MKLPVLILLYASLTISSANGQCTWYTKISTSNFTSHTLGIKNDSSLWAWGQNNKGQLGDGATVNKMRPTQINAGSRWISIATGTYHSLAVKADGTLWAWGMNNQGQLGDGTTIDKTNAIQIGAAANWVSVAAGHLVSLGIKSDGTLWGWGDNNYGQLSGNSSRITPAQIGTSTNWISVAVGLYHTIGLKSDGTVWAWGTNTNGQLGDGTTTDRAMPVQIGAATDWVSVTAGGEHNLAIKKNGSLWVWGGNDVWLFGNYTVAEPTTPMQLSADEWSSVAAGSADVIGTKTDGTLWRWQNSDQITIVGGDWVPVYECQQTDADANWSWVTYGNASMFGIKTDGSLYSRGNNDNGQLGNGTTNNQPVANKIYAAPNFTLPAVNSSISQTQTGFTIYNSDCSLIASITKKGGSTAINGSTTAKVWVEAIQPAAYLKRHYDIKPAANASTATGKVTLYFTQQEFSDLNAVNEVKLPVDAADADNFKANLMVEEIDGTSSDGTGLPYTYSGASVTINPADNDIVWNPTNGYWEVTFYTSGFGGFFIKTQTGKLFNPLDKAGLTRTTPGAVVYSLRLLSSSYTGPAIQVRRDNDNTTQDIGFNAAGYLDGAALRSFVGSNNGYVSRWYDQSGNGIDAKQTDVSKQPIIVRAGVVEKVNGLPAVYFGSASLATAKLMIFTKAASMVGVAKGNNSTPSTFVSKTGTAAGNNPAHPAPFDYTNTGAEFTVGNAATATYNLIWANTSTPKSTVNNSVDLSIYSFVIPSSGTYRNYVNGVQAGSNTVTAFQDGGNALLLGNRNDGGGSGNFWTSEIMLFNLALSTTERQTLEVAQAILPLEWLLVKGQLTNRNTAQLTWHVNEEQVKSYQVEKSTEGIAYTIIGEVASTGNGTHAYSFTESQVLSCAAYYRIRQTDLDGRFTYSTVITLNNQATSPVTVYPNPAEEIVTVTTSVQLLSTVATLYNANGTALQSFTINATAFTINLRNYPAGIYYLKTADGEVARIVKK